MNWCYNQADLDARDKLRIASDEREAREAQRGVYIEPPADGPTDAELAIPELERLVADAEVRWRALEAADPHSDAAWKARKEWMAAQRELAMVQELVEAGWPNQL